MNLLVYDIDPKQVDLVARMGARAATSTAQLARESDTLISILPNDFVLNKVSKGKDGLIDNMKKGGVHVSCSTVSPHTSRELAPLYQERGSVFVGAPVFARFVFL
jgi:3-hydroxyisobutyrate dehydrogenase-like beta-hydroxyacid dehydrogenase